MLVLHSVCLAAYRFYRGQRSSRVLCPLLPVVVPVLDCLQLVHRQLTLGQRRTTQLCLAYLYFHLPRSFTGLQALHLARLIAGFPPSAKLSSSRSGVLEATVRRKKTVATHSKSSTTESVLSAKRQVPESTKMGRVHQIQRQCRESLSVTHESFRVTSKLSALPFYPRELPLQHYDVVQVKLLRNTFYGSLKRAVLFSGQPGKSTSFGHQRSTLSRYLFCRSGLYVCFV